MTLCALVLFVFSANAVKVVFRLDDPSVSCDSVHMRVLQLFQDKGVPLSVAVIPCAKGEIPYMVTDSNYWALLNSQTVEIALHGLTHEDIHSQGEFGSLSAEETNRRFKKGIEILNKHFHKPISTFIPPFNATNSSFPENLAKNGFTIISADLFQEVPCKSDIQYYPETLGHLMEQRGIWRAAKESICQCSECHAICVIMFHAYDLPDSGAWLQLENLLDYCANNDQIELHTFSSLRESGESSSWLRYSANQLSSGLSNLVLKQGVLHATWFCLLVHTANALIYIIFAVLGLLIIIFRSHTKAEKTSFIVAAIVIGLVVFSFAWFHWLSPLKLLLLSVSINLLPIVYTIIRPKMVS